ncbi:MAG: M35 family metallo-endopeptidase [Arenimonas sp.]
MTHRNRSLVLAAGLVALTGFAVTANSARVIPFGNPLRISINADANNAGTVQFKVTNTSNQAIKVPSWQLPSGALDSDLFDVYRGSEKIDYVGKMIKRGPLRDSDFITLRPGETKLVNADLSAVYDMTTDGEYSIRFRSYMQDAKSQTGHTLTTNNGQMALLETPDLRTSIRSAAPTVSDMQLDMNRQLQKVGGGASTKATTVVNGVTFVGCTSSRTTSAGQAVVQARTYANNAKAYLTAGTAGPRYTTWFGSYTSSRYSTAKSHYTNISSALAQSGGQIKINCGCTDNYYAYVYPNQPYQIYVCNAFWSAGLTGTDSKAGTLVHETSHFDIVANTDDVVYGQTGAKNLAISNPTNALRNADSHEYFAENTPYKN